MPYTDLITQFSDYLQSHKRYSIHTVRSYEADLRNLEHFNRERYEAECISAITPQVMKSWLSSLKADGLEARSINRKLSAARSFFKYLLRLKIVSVNPASGIPSLKAKKNLPVFVDQAQLQQVLHRNFFASGFEGDTHHLIFSLFYATGMRVSELVALKETDIHSSASVISVLGKGNKERQIPVEASVLDTMHRYMAEKKRLFEHPAPYLLVGSDNLPLSRRTVYSIVRSTLTEVTTIQKKSPHVLRHSIATHLSDHGAPIGAIKELLGHSSLAATQIYTHTSIARLKEIHEQSHPKA